MNNNPKKTIVNIPPYEVFRITDQLEVLVMENRVLPLVAFRLVIWGGCASDPAGKEGLTRLTANLLAKGAGKYSADSFAYAVESKGATLNVTAGYDFVILSGEFLSRDLEYGLELLAIMLNEPKFEENEITFLKNKTVNDLAAINDEPGQLCSVIHNKNLFGDHPYGNPVRGYQSSVTNLNRESIVNNHKSRLLNSRMLLSVIGDVKVKKVMSKVKQLFSNLNNKPSGKKNYKKADDIKGISIYVVDKDDQTQAQIRIGNIGLARNNPDYHNFLVTNTLFGGSFTSRLMTEIRVNRGLTYGIRSNIAAYKEPGSLTISTFTKTESTALTIELILKEIKQIQNEKISEKELSDTKKYLTGLYPLSLETNKLLLHQLSNVRFYGLPENSIEKHIDNINMVSESDVSNSANKYYSGTDSVITILGNADKIVPEIEKFGTVKKIKSSDFIKSYTPKQAAS